MLRREPYQLQGNIHIGTSGFATYIVEKPHCLIPRSELVQITDLMVYIDAPQVYASMDTFTSRSNVCSASHK